MANPGANADIRYGLRPVKHQHGAPYNGEANLYYVPAGYATALFIGDPVVKTGTSNTAKVVTGAGEYAAGTLPEINKAGAGDDNATTGVIVGFLPKPNDLETVHSKASTEDVAVVADDPMLIFHIRDDGASALAATSVGLNAVYIYTHAGDAATGISGVELDTASDAPAADASNQLTILRLASMEGNEIAARAQWEVRINNHTEAHGTLGI